MNDYINYLNELKTSTNFRNGEIKLRHFPKLLREKFKLGYRKSHIVFNKWKKTI